MVGDDMAANHVGLHMIAGVQQKFIRCLIAAQKPMLAAQLKSRITRWCVRAYLLPGKLAFRCFPVIFRRLSLGRAYGRHLQALVCLYHGRSQSHSTFFLRNRPELDLMCRLLDRKPAGATADVVVVACSKGAEVYSIIWKIRSARPDLRLKVSAVDISQEIVDFAKAGTYSLTDVDPSGALNCGLIAKTGDLTWKDQILRKQALSMFGRMTSQEMTGMFDVEGDQAKIKPWLKEGVTWLCRDAADPAFSRPLGLQDVVVANRFLCHMEPQAAERCLRNIARTVRPGGYLFLSGVDLDVRTKVARDLGWRPITDMIREVHEGDWSLTEGWPFNYWGLEPFCQDRPDWKFRYASVFQVGSPS